MVDLKIKLPDGFLDEEVRGGYTIKKQMKEVWAVELDLLAEFDRVCKKYNIKYFMDSGTLLGAVRNGEFIPWDDDIDVVIFREDYEKLKQIGNQEFKDPYFFQTAYTDTQYFRGHAQLRNSNTTGSLECEKWVSFNQGIFIDIFVLDGVGDGEELEIQFKRKQEILYKEYKFFGLNSADIFKRKVKKLLYVLFRKRSIEMFKEYERICAQFSNTEYVDKISFRNNSNEIKALKRSWFSSDVLLKFEFLEIPAPQDYNGVLEKYYGKDFMTPRSTPTAHGGVIFDADISYKDKLKRK